MLWDTVVPHVFELLVIGILVLTASYEITHIKRKSVAMAVLIYAVFTFYIIASASIKDSTDQQFRAIYEYTFYILMIFSGIYYYQRVEFQRIAKNMVIFGCLIAALSWYEYITRSYLIGSFAATIQSTYGFRAAVFSRTYLSHGVILGVFAILAYYMFLDTSEMIYLASSILCYISILTTSSRGPLVACTAGLILMWFVNYYSSHSNIQKRIYIIFALLLVLIAIMMFLESTFTTGNPTIDYFLLRTRNIINWNGDAGNVGRVYWWEYAINNWFKKSPWFGIGPSKTGSWGEGAIGVTESGFLKHLCELGIIGAIIYYSLIAYIITRGIINYKKEIENNKLAYLCLFGIVTMIMINDITVQTTEQIEVSFYLNTALGGLLAVNNKYR